MRKYDDKTFSGNPTEAHFKTTHWSVVLQAGQSISSQAGKALARLCQDYWYPLYAYVRRRGYSPQEAQDLTQDFFLRFLERQGIQQADRQRGKFRTFLLSSLGNFLANEWDKRKAVKRGGRCFFESWDALGAEERYNREPFHESTAEKLYERRWALTLLERTLNTLRREHAASRQAEVFDVLQSYLTGNENEETYQEAAARLGLSEAAVKMRVLRLRQRYRELLRAEIAETVSSPQELQEELKHLFSVLA